MNRRDFIRRGSLWVAGAVAVEPVIKRLWAFPTNPLGGYNKLPLRLTEIVPGRPSHVGYPMGSLIWDQKSECYWGWTDAGWESFRVVW